MRSSQPATESTLPPETVGRYTLIRPIGSGGMASVYLAQDPVFERAVALKLIHAYLCEEAAMIERFRREAVTLSMLKHPAVVPVHDAGRAAGRPYLAMRHMEGGSLQSRLGGGALAPREAAAILLRIAPALDAAHAMGIVHRDVKPGNILFDREGRAYLSDFGLVRLLGAGSEITQREFFGTPAYAAPEQARGDGPVDGRADVYALAAVLFRMLTGALPYDASTPHGVLRRQIEDPLPRMCERAPGIPDALQGVVERAMAKRPEERFPTAAAFAQAAAQAIENAPRFAPSARRLGGDPAAGNLLETEQATPVPEIPSRLIPIGSTAPHSEESLSEQSMKLAFDPSPIASTPGQRPTGETPILPRRLRGSLMWILGAGLLLGLLAMVYATVR